MFKESFTLTKEEIKDWVTSMLTRPEMHAQCPGALEDRVTTLLGLLWEDPPTTSHSGHKLGNRSEFWRQYQDFLREKFGSGIGPATNYTGDNLEDMKKLAEVLKEFIGTLPL